MLIPCPHFRITIRKRGSSSAVFGAAYAAGEKLYSEYECQTKNYSYKKSEVLYSEILLPENAPKSFYDRETLWNSAESAEKQYNSQLARVVVASLPREIPKEQLPELVKEFCNEQFVKKGMCCDFSIYDKGNGNPHVHIQLTLRALDENGKWLPKCRNEYDLDENGEKIRLPSGAYKRHPVNITDWNKKENCEFWRSEWAKIQNTYYEKNNLDIRVDLRSYKRQNIGILPTVHLGPYAYFLEKKGIETERGNLNRAIKEHNKEKAALLEEIENLKADLSDINEKLGRFLSNSRREPTLAEILLDYIEIQKSGDSDWGFYLKPDCPAKDTEKVSEAISFVKENNLDTFSSFQSTFELSEKKGKIGREKKETKQIISKLKDIHETGSTYNKYRKSPFKDSFYKQYKEEIDRYISAEKFLGNHGLPVSANIEPFEARYRKLRNEYKSIGDNIPEKGSEKYERMRDISGIISDVLADMGIQTDIVQNRKEKESILRKLEAGRESVRVRSEGERKPIENIRDNR